MKLLMTMSILLMTTGVFAQQHRSMRAHIGERTHRVDQTKVLESRVVEKSPHMHSAIKGTVRMDERGCGLHVEVPGNEGLVNVYPVNLPDSFKVDGKNILFDYAQVNPKFEAECPNLESVMVSNVKPRRKSQL